MKQIKKNPLEGYLLLKPVQHVHYRGVDRPHFEPILKTEEIDQNYSPATDDDRIWTFYPPGWKRDSYRLFEENMIITEHPDLSLLTDIDVVHKIQKIIQPYIGCYEIIHCTIYSSQELDSVLYNPQKNFLGYDIAYLGGDYYSAIFNGIFINANDDLIKNYSRVLNRFGLFSNLKVVEKYLREFKINTKTELSSNFYVYALAFELA